MASNMPLIFEGGAVTNATRNSQVTVTHSSIEMEKVSFPLLIYWLFYILCSDNLNKQLLLV
jgi:hypothetical protein